MSRLLLARHDALLRLARTEGVSFFTPAEAARWRGFSRPQRREQYRLGRWLLRLACADAVGGAPRDWSFAAGGPPLARHRRGWKAPWLSLSHSGDCFAAALSTVGPVGVDIERRDQARDWAALARHQGWRLGRPAKDDFLRRWCEFEARFKAPRAPHGWRFETAAFHGHLAGPEGPGPTWRSLR